MQKNVPTKWDERIVLLRFQMIRRQQEKMTSKSAAAAQYVLLHARASLTDSEDEVEKQKTNNENGNKRGNGSHRVREPSQSTSDPKATLTIIL